MRSFENNLCLVLMCIKRKIGEFSYFFLIDVDNLSYYLIKVIGNQRLIKF